STPRIPGVGGPCPVSRGTRGFASTGEGTRLASADPVLLTGEGEEPRRFQLPERGEEGDLDDARVAADLDPPRDGRAVAHLGHAHPEEVRRALESVLGRG